MPIKTIFLDRDGVINKEVNYLYKIDDESFKEMMGLIKRRGSFPDGWGYLESQYDLSLTIEQNFWLEGIENEYGDVHRKSFDNPDQWVANLQPKQMKP